MSKFIKKLRTASLRRNYQLLIKKTVAPYVKIIIQVVIGENFPEILHKSVILRILIKNKPFFVFQTDKQDGFLCGKSNTRAFCHFTG